MSPDGSHAVHAAESSEDLDATLKIIRDKSGAEYVAVRDRLLAMPHDKVAPKLKTVREQTKDPVEQLLWDAILIRLKDLQDEEQMFKVGRVEGDKVTQATHLNVRNKVDFTLDELKYLAGVDQGPAIRRRMNPDVEPMRHPYDGTYVLIKYLEDDALPVAAELVVKRIVDGWHPWEQEAILLTFTQFGWQELDTKNAKEIKDRRAGHVLLWMAEHASTKDTPLPKDPMLRPAKTFDPRGPAPRNPAGLAAYHLVSFPDRYLLKTAETARDRAADARRKEILTQAVKNIEQGLKKYEQRHSAR